MKLLKLSGCQFPGNGGNVNRLTMIVEEQGISFWTRVQLPSAPLKKSLVFTRLFLFEDFSLLELFRSDSETVKIYY